jgi:hypothetical protein
VPCTAGTFGDSRVCDAGIQNVDSSSSIELDIDFIFIEKRNSNEINP